MNTSIAITISPPIRKLYSKNLEPFNLLFQDDKLHIQSVFQISRIKTYLIYPEFDSKGRLHYHGIINLDCNEYVRFYKHSIHKLGQIGFVDVKKIPTFIDKLKWIIYMSKDWGISRDILSIDTPIMSQGKVKVKSIQRRNPFEVDSKSESIFYYFK